MGGGFLEPQISPESLWYIRKGLPDETEIRRIGGLEQGIIVFAQIVSPDSVFREESERQLRRGPPHSSDFPSGWAHGRGPFSCSGLGEQGHGPPGKMGLS